MSRKIGLDVQEASATMVFPFADHDPKSGAHTLYNSCMVTPGRKFGIGSSWVRLAPTRCCSRSRARRCGIMNVDLAGNHLRILRFGSPDLFALSTVIASNLFAPS